MEGGKRRVERGTSVIPSIISIIKIKSEADGHLSCSPKRGDFKNLVDKNTYGRL